MTKNQRFEWTNEYILEFLEQFKGEPCIWNPLNMDNRNRNKVADAWQRIQHALSFDCSINDLKKKKDSLMATYRSLVSKKKKCLKPGMAADELFKSNWFAFEIMDKFLAPVYHCNIRINAESNSIETESEYICSIIQDAVAEDDEDTIDVDANYEQPNCDANKSTNSVFCTTNPSPKIKRIKTISKKERKNQIDDTVHAEKLMEDAFDILKEVAAGKDKEKDECDLYGELLAKKLRRFNDCERDSIMLDIDILLLEKKKAIMNKFPNHHKSSKK